MFIILYLFQLNENSVLLRFSFPIIFHFEFRLKVTINQSFPSTVTPPSKSINVCQINEKGDFRRISHFYPNLRFPDCIQGGLKKNAEQKKCFISFVCISLTLIGPGGAYLPTAISKQYLKHF